MQAVSNMMKTKTEIETESPAPPLGHGSRRGKIARLPGEVRDELNQRLLDGESGGGLMDWLNDLPQVKAALQREFGGRPITEQNLSEWRQGGFRDWIAKTEAAELMDETLADSREMHGHGENCAPLEVARGLEVRPGNLFRTGWRGGSSRIMWRRLEGNRPRPGLPASGGRSCAPSAPIWPVSGAVTIMWNVCGYGRRNYSSSQRV
jgi:hypothetical protein